MNEIFNNVIGKFYNVRVRMNSTNTKAIVEVEGFKNGYDKVTQIVDKELMNSDSFLVSSKITVPNFVPKYVKTEVKSILKVLN